MLRNGSEEGPNAFPPHRLLAGALTACNVLDVTFFLTTFPGLRLLLLLLLLYHQLPAGTCHSIPVLS